MQEKEESATDRECRFKARQQGIEEHTNKTHEKKETVLDRVMKESQSTEEDRKKGQEQERLDIEQALKNSRIDSDTIRKEDYLLE